MQQDGWTVTSSPLHLLLTSFPLSPFSYSCLISSAESGSYNIREAKIAPPNRRRRLGFPRSSAAAPVPGLINRLIQSVNVCASEQARRLYVYGRACVHRIIRRHLRPAVVMCPDPASGPAGKRRQRRTDGRF